MSTAEQSEVSQRFAELVEGMGEALGFRRGWRKQVAEQLGLHPSDVTKIRQGTRQVGWDLAERTAKRIGLDLSYFTEGGHYTNYIDLSSGPPVHTQGLERRQLWERAREVYDLLRRQAPDRRQVGKLLALEVLDSETAQRAKAVVQAEAGAEQEQLIRDLVFDLMEEEIELQSPADGAGSGRDAVPPAGQSREDTDATDTT